MFFVLLEQVHDAIQHVTKRNHALTPAQQLLIELRLLSSGLFQQVIADTMKVHKSTICRTISRVTKALLSIQKYILFIGRPHKNVHEPLQLFINHRTFPVLRAL